MIPASVHKASITVVGLGYVGLPLALHMAKQFDVTGFDVDEGRIGELKSSHDRTGEIESTNLQGSLLKLTSDQSDIKNVDVYIVTVPTPVDEHNHPDLAAVRSACKMIGGVMAKGAIIVFESTVYPGVTEDICGPLLAAVSGLECGEDFYLGYSPERINPGDKVHTVDKIMKIVAGQTPEVTAFLEEMYGAVTTGGVFVARNIRTAEAAKAIENAQRDINIAFVNEAAMIFNQIGVSIHDVLDAAKTKWNFLPFEPGLVGGHCIGIDPYYLTHLASEVGLDSEVILAGRRINDSMAGFVAGRIDERLKQINSASQSMRILVLGVTFKENVPDLRNSKAIDLVEALKQCGHQVDVHDTMADAGEALEFMGIELQPDLALLSDYDCVLGVVPHDEYRAFERSIFESLLTPNGLVADLKNIWGDVDLGDDLQRWVL